MKKAFKIIGISLASLIGLCLIVVCVLLWIVFTPSRVTPIVNDIAKKYITCETQVENIELTFFSTFPQFGVKLNNLRLINPTPGAPFDTLAALDALTVTFDAKALLKNKEIILHNFYLKNGVANAYIDSLGNTNFNIVATEPSEEDTSAFENPFSHIDLQKIALDNINFCYVDEQNHINTALRGLNAKLDGNMQDMDNLNANLKMQFASATFALTDSTNLNTSLNNGDISVKGKVNNNMVDATLTLELPGTSVRMDTTQYLNNADIKTELPFTFDLNNQKLNIHKGEISLNDISLNVDGMLHNHADSATTNMDMDINIASTEWGIAEVLSLVPDQFVAPIADMKMDGKLKLSGTLKGTYSATSFPAVIANVLVSDGTFSMKDLPCNLHHVNADLAANIDLNKQQASDVQINSLQAQTGKSTIKVKGSINDLLDQLRCNLNINGNLNFADIMPFVPSDLPLTLAGSTTLAANTKFTLQQITNLDLAHILLNGTFNIKNLQARYDSLTVFSNATDLKVNLPCKKKTSNFSPLLNAEINATDLHIAQDKGIIADATNANLNVAVSDFLKNTNALPSLSCDYNIGTLIAQLDDTTSVSASHPVGNVALTPSKRNPKNPDIAISYSNESLAYNQADNLTARTNALSISASCTYDDTKTELLDQFHPIANIKFSNGNITTTALTQSIRIPDMELAFSPEKIKLNDCRIIIGKSDFTLGCVITNLRGYLKNEGLLKGDMTFTSDVTDVNQLMNLVSGFGSDDYNLAENMDTTKSEPFMVPLGVDFVVNTTIKNAFVAKERAFDLNGRIYVQNGNLVLQEVGFICAAARMRLTAIYQSPRPNNLFLGMDFHMEDIKIDELVKMIPDIDTILPMLKAFDGKGEFHFCAETNLNSNYDIKWSTMRGAADIRGKDLVVLDNETFQQVSKLLLFSKDTKNVIDSLSADIILFRDQIDVMPFMVSMDKYSAILEGRHYINNDFNYRISLTRSPIKVKLGLDINGRGDKMKYKVGKSKHSTLIAGEKMKTADKQALEIRDIIYHSLIDTKRLEKYEYIKSDEE